MDRDGGARGSGGIEELVPRFYEATVVGHADQERRDIDDVRELETLALQGGPKVLDAAFRLRPDVDLGSASGAHRGALDGVVRLTRAEPGKEHERSSTPDVCVSRQIRPAHEMPARLRVHVAPPEDGVLMFSGPPA